MGRVSSTKEIKHPTGIVTSRFFARHKNQQKVSEDQSTAFPFNCNGKWVHHSDLAHPFDIKYLKSLNSTDYFQLIDKLTNDDPSEWAIPLPPHVIRELEGNPLTPKNFIPIYSRIRQIRARIVAPVDKMGCHMVPILISQRYGITKDRINPRDYRLQLLISLVLATLTKNEVVTKVMLALTEYCVTQLGYTSGITLDAMLEIAPRDLERLIVPTRFYRQKALRITQMVRAIRERFNSDVPTNIEGMTSLPGVGPKIGFLALQKSWGRIDGICVDLHVHRLCRQFNFVDPQKCVIAEQTRQALELWLPRDLWYEINIVLVGFGQMVCTSTIKKCDLCPVNDICNVW